MKRYWIASAVWIAIFLLILVLISLLTGQTLLFYTTSFLLGLDLIFIISLGMRKVYVKYIRHSMKGGIQKQALFYILVFSLNANAIYIILALVQLFGIQSYSRIMPWMTVGIIFLDLFLLKIYANQTSHSRYILLRKIFLFGFLAVAILILLVGLFPDMPVMTAFNDGIIYLIMAFVGLGLMAFYTNQDVIDLTHKEREEYVRKCLSRAKDFDSRYPWLAALHVDFGFKTALAKGSYFVALRRLLASPILLLGRFVYSTVRWMYKEGWLYSVTFLALSLVAFFIRLYNLGTLSLWYDEVITGRVVTRILETGIPLDPSGLTFYWRGVTYHYFVSIFTGLFSNNEFWIRLPSALFGTGIIIATFFILKRYNRYLAILACAFLTFSTYNLEYSRFARFYVMNAFLFLLLLMAVYIGFFKDRTGYKILSLIIGLVMVHTVQIGRLFFFVILSAIALKFVYSIRNVKFVKFLRNNILDGVYLLLAGVIVLLGNLFKTFIGSERVPIVYAYELNEALPKPPNMSFPLIKMPDWYMSSFFQDHYMPVVLLALPIVLFLSLMLFRRKREEDRYMKFLLMALFLSFMAFETFNRDTSGPRLYLFAEPLILAGVLVSVYLISRMLFKGHLLAQVSTTVVILLVLISMKPAFHELLMRGYGENTSNDPFRTSHCAIFRSDMKTPYEYLRENIREEDILVVLKDIPYFYIKRAPNYVIDQHYRWNSQSIPWNGSYYTQRGSKLINDAASLDDVLAQGKPTWIVINARHTELECSTYIRNDIELYLESLNQNVVFRAKDGVSRVYLVNV